MYKVREFAERAGVTVRTLHHYDRLGLLPASGRTQAGYRLYGERDLVRLQQIVTLKFIGLSLQEIKALLLDRTQPDLTATLRLQRLLLVEKRRRVEMAIQAIDQAEWSTQPGCAPDWKALKKIIEVMEMQSNMDWTKKYYSDEAQAKIAEGARTWTPELQAQVSQQWEELFAEIKAAIAKHEDPGGAKAQALAEHWSELVRGFTGGDPEIQKGVNRLYADQANWPANFHKPWSDELEAFIMKAMAAHKRSNPPGKD
jgi:MerR family transcriptional regulator, thiopeptide resistance regulator